LTVTLVLGGARSGKSAVAESLIGDGCVYVATAEVTDDDMAARVAAHRDRRPTWWTTVETDDIAAALRDHSERAVLVDSLGTWIARAPQFCVDTDDLLDALAHRTAPTVLVSEEVGLGVHPETEVGRHWRDAIGEVNQRLAAVADDVLLVVAGRVLHL